MKLAARRRRLLVCSLATGAALLAWGCSSSDDDGVGDDEAADGGTTELRDATTTRAEDAAADARVSSSSGGGSSGGSSSGAGSVDSGSTEDGGSSDDAGPTEPDDASVPGTDDAGSIDAGPPEVDAASPVDAGPAPNGLPGLSCSGTLTDAGMVALYSQKPVTGTPSYFLGGSSQARRIGTYTSAVYTRHCDSAAGCGEWTPAAQPNYEHFESINTTVRQGIVYLWNREAGDDRIGIVSDTVGDDCLGWTEGSGPIQRAGTTGSVTLEARVQDNCVAGADPVFYFNQIDLYDPTGIVTDHCMKLSYSKQLQRVDIGPGAYVYEEYVVVYDATY